LTAAAAGAQEAGTREATPNLPTSWSAHLSANKRGTGGGHHSIAVAMAPAVTAATAAAAAAAAAAVAAAVRFVAADLQWTIRGMVYTVNAPSLIATRAVLPAARAACLPGGIAIFPALTANNVAGGATSAALSANCQVASAATFTTPEVGTTAAHLVSTLCVALVDCSAKAKCGAAAAAAVSAVTPAAAAAPGAAKAAHRLQQCPFLSACMAGRVYAA
jgi:hypothetical protein